MTQNEEWKPINNYEGIYEISNLGNVRSFHKGYWKTLKPSKDKQGYLRVILYKNGKRKRYGIHRLVALHFIPNSENKPQVNHIDENKENNVVSNLEWSTSTENANHGTRNERMSKKKNKKVSCYDSVSGDFICEYESIRQACNALKKPFNFGGSISACCKGRLNTSQGYRWSYEKKNNFFD